MSTRCRSIDEFVEKFVGFASEGALVLPAAGELPVGTEGRFVIRLADQSVAMRGRCRVTDVQAIPPGPRGPRRALLRVALLELEEGSRVIHAQLLARRQVPVPPSVGRGGSGPVMVRSPAPVPPLPLRTPPPPPVAALARTMTMIGMAPGAGARTSTATGAPQRTGTRVPGAAFTLPANPLGALDVEDLSLLVDNTLFETDRDATTDLTATPQPEVDLPIEVAAAVPAVLAAAVPAAPIAVVPALLAAASPAVPASGVARQRPAAAPLRSPARRVATRLAPYALCLIIGLWIGHALHAPPRAPPSALLPQLRPNPVPAPAQSPLARRALAEPVPPQVPPTPVTEPRGKPAEPVPPRAPVAASAAPETASPGDCAARVVTEPADAKIVWQGKLLGRSPIEGARVPCGAATVTIEHERYQSVTRQVAAASGAPLVVSQKLHRPPGTLIVSTSPPRAYITVNDQMLGVAPRRLDVWRFEQASIRASFPGYLPWTKRVYLKDATTKVTAQLVPTGRPGVGKRSPAGR